MRAVDLFAGPGGWDVAAQRLGIETVGVEFDDAAVATRRAYGLNTLHADVNTLDPRYFGACDGLIASPPCQTFSAAGNGAGRKALDKVLEAVRRVGDGITDPALVWDGIDVDDVRTRLVVEPLRWVAIMRPQWLAFEQVATVLPVWQSMAYVLREWGYTIDVGNVQAEQYGVPQTRRRAILVASRVDRAELPVPTHSKYHARDPKRLDPGVLPWVSMAEALGWDTLGGLEARADEREAFTELGQQRTYRAEVAERKAWAFERPATTLAGRPLVADPGTNANRYNGSTKSRNDGVKVTLEEAAVLQSFPADYPWQGTKSKQWEQVGNAIPPLLAEAILRAVAL